MVIFALVCPVRSVHALNECSSPGGYCYEYQTYCQDPDGTFRGCCIGTGCAGPDGNIKE
jgi:hypothetical protein